MIDQPSITNVDNQKLIETIAEARRRIVYLAPGITEPVAEALSERWSKLGTHAVTVILDVEPEVCRVGYGTIEGLKRITEAALQAGASVCQQPGLRLGLLISDEFTLIYSPTPLLIETSVGDPTRPNAIQLAAPPKQVAEDVGLEEQLNPQRVVGVDPVKPDQIDAVAKDLERAPPVKFDLTRRVRVFTSRFQFVELEMSGCYLSRKKVPIPSRLIGLAKNQDIQSQFHAHFNLINKGKLEVKADDGRTINEKTLQKQRQDIVRDFLISLTGYGSVVLRANKQKLIDAVEKLEADVTAFQEGIKANLQREMDANAKALVDALLPTVLHSPPDAYTKFHGPHITGAQIRQFLKADIIEAFGQAEDMVQEMRVSLVFKDLAYESLVDTKFLEIAR